MTTPQRVESRHFNELPLARRCRRSKSQIAEQKSATGKNRHCRGVALHRNSKRDDSSAVNRGAGCANFHVSQAKGVEFVDWAAGDTGPRAVRGLRRFRVLSFNVPTGRVGQFNGTGHARIEKPGTKP